MRSTPTTRSTTPLALAMLAGALGSSPASAHDDDVRKLLDRLPPVFGPIYRTPAIVPTPVDRAEPQGGFDAFNMTLLAQIPLNNFPGVNTNSGNDCWGYVSASGREYAIMGLEGGFGFVEVTNPTNPVIVDTISGPTSLWHDVKVVGSYAYGVSEGGSGVQVMDLSDIDNGNVTLVRNWTSGGYSTTHNIVTNLDNGSLWICGANIGNGGLINLDISNPTLPQFNGGWTEMYVHDAQVVTWEGGAFDGRELAFCASGFSGGFSETGLRIVDVTNPNAPVTLATLFYPNAGYAHQVWLSEDRSTLYLNDELDEGSTVSVTTTRIIDVRDPANPVLLGTHTTGKAAIDHNLYVDNALAYQANYRSGLRVFDTLDPENPVEVAYFDTFPNSDAAAFNGAWSSYPFFPSGTIVVSDIERGLFVLRLDAQLDGFALSDTGTNPALVDPAGGDSLSVKPTLRDGVSLTQVTLMADSGSGFSPTPMTLNPDGTYSAPSPAIACGQTLRYYFQATDDQGLTKTVPGNAPAETLEAQVVSDIVVAVDEDFQSAPGWSVSGSVSDGAWDLGVPVGGGDRGDPPSDFDGSGNCYLTDNADGNSDVDGGTTVLTSPALDASGQSPILSYALWFSNNVGEVDDSMVVEISNDNGASWTTLDTIGPGDPEAGGGWNLYEFSLDSIFAAPSSQVRVRFLAADTGTPSVVEAAVDALRIESRTCEDPAPECAADFSGNGATDFPDVGMFLAAFSTGDLAADFSGNGAADFPDVGLFLAAFSAGCP